MTNSLSNKIQTPSDFYAAEAEQDSDDTIEDRYYMFDTVNAQRLLSTTQEDKICLIWSTALAACNHSNHFNIQSRA
jgi:hypothetical protein